MEVDPTEDAGAEPLARFKIADWKHARESLTHWITVLPY
jgi:hypothetical protein